MSQPVSKAGTATTPEPFMPYNFATEFVLTKGREWSSDSLFIRVGTAPIVAVGNVAAGAIDLVSQLFAAAITTAAVAVRCVVYLITLGNSGNFLNRFGLSDIPAHLLKSLAAVFTATLGTVVCFFSPETALKLTDSLGLTSGSTIEAPKLNFKARWEKAKADGFSGVVKFFGEVTKDYILKPPVDFFKWGWTKFTDLKLMERVAVGAIGVVALLAIERGYSRFIQGNDWLDHSKGPFPDTFNGVIGGITSAAVGAKSLYCKYVGWPSVQITTP